jgi:hypothetical protein
MQPSQLPPSPPPAPPPPPPQRPRYRLYIDESGDHTYKLLDDLSHRYLALLGVWFRQHDHYTAFADDLERFKREIFGPRPDKPVVLHRSDIINRKGPFGLLCQPDVQGRCDAGLLEIVARAQFKMVCVIINKQDHLTRYASPFHPYHYCLAAMLDRYSGWLNYKNAVGDVMAESRGKEENLQLEEAYRRVYESGTLMFNHMHHRRALTSKDIKIQPKVANIAGLQLADVLAHPVKQACLIEKGWLPDPGDGFGKHMCESARTKFNCNEFRGIVPGYGKVFR